MSMKYSEMTQLFIDWQKANSTNSLAKPENSDLLAKIRELKKDMISYMRHSSSFKGAYDTAWFKQLQIQYNAYLTETSALDLLNNSSEFINNLNSAITDIITEINTNTQEEKISRANLPISGYSFYDASHESLDANSSAAGKADIKHDNFNFYDGSISYADDQLSKVYKKDGKTLTKRSQDKKNYLTTSDFLVEVKCTQESKNLERVENFHNADLVLIYELSKKAWYCKINLGNRTNPNYSKLKPVGNESTFQVKGTIILDRQDKIKTGDINDTSKEILDQKTPPVVTDIDVLNGDTSDKVNESITEKPLTEFARIASWNVQYDDPVLLNDIEVTEKENGKLTVKNNNSSKISNLRGEENKQLRIDAIKDAKQIIDAINNLGSTAYSFEKDVELMIKVKLDELYPGVVENARKSAAHSFSGQPSRESLVKVEEKAYCGAIVLKYFADKISEYSSAKKDSTKRAIIDLDQTQIDAAKDWLKEHTRFILFRFPQNDDDSYVGRLSIPDDEAHQEQRAQSSQAKEDSWNNALARFRDKYPDAVEGEDYVIRYTSEIGNPNFEPVNPAAEIVFDIRVVDAPDCVKKMIDNAKSLNPEATKKTSQMTNEKMVSSLGFVNAVLKLFNHDLHFYDGDGMTSLVNNYRK